MTDQFSLNANIRAIGRSGPIQFSHRKSIDRPDNHVLHLNNYVEIYIYVSGNHHFIVEDSLYKLTRGDVIMINPREVHKALPLTEGPYERFYFLLEEHTFDAMELDPLRQILNLSCEFGNLISMKNKSEDLLKILYSISDCFHDGRDDQLRALGLFLQFLAELNQHYVLSNSLNNYDNTCMTTSPPKLLKDILTYVAEHTAEIQSAAEISSALGVSPQYLSNYFSKQIGTPLKTFIQAKKIAMSKELLKKGGDVTGVCYDCGFNDCSYFIKIFKKYVGITPMAYKKLQNSYPSK